MKKTVVKAAGISKSYRLYSKPMDRLKEALNVFGKKYHTEVYALQDINFEIEEGESLGIIGSNGSGKSTLLKILTGVLNPTTGITEVDGNVSALLELGAGFNQDYTGIENIYLSGMIMGYSRNEIEAKIPDIVAFAGIGNFIHQPVKTYSSGMFVRLAFATQIYVNPDILIVDEALSVGDMRFQQKCYRAMEEMMKNKTVILVTHDPGAVLRFCSRVIWIEKGKIMYDGGVEEGMRRYQSFLLNNMEVGKIEEHDRKGMSTFSQELALLPIADGVQSAGTGEAEIIQCGLFDKGGERVETVDPGEDYRFAIKIRFLQPVVSAIVGISVRNRLGEDAFGMNSDMIGLNVDSTKKEAEYIFSFPMPELNVGQYTISPAVATGTHEDHVQLCWLHDAWIFNVGKRTFDTPGMLYTENFEISVKKEEY